MVGQVNKNYLEYEPIFKGIQLDDHFAWPTELPGPSAQDRINAMNSFALKIMQEITPDYFSLAPSIMPYSFDKFSVDWPLWVSNGWVYQIVVQLYRYTYQDFANALNAQLQYSKYF